MKKRITKVLLVLVVAILALEIKAYAASFSIAASAKTVEPGSDVTITITGNNVYGKVDLKGTNITLSENSVWLDSNIKVVTGKITGKSGDTATVTATPETDNLVNSENPEEVITGAKSVSIEIKEKEVETPAPVTEQEPAQPPVENPQTTPTTTTTTPPQTTQQAETPKQEKDTTKTTPKKTEPTQPAPEPESSAQEIVPDNENQGTPSEFGITEMRIYGVMPDGIKQELEYTPVFNINQPVYSCKLTKDMVNINIEIQANEYKDMVKVENPEEIKEGENIFRISMDDGNGRSKQYVIRAIKEETEKTEEELANELNEEEAVNPEDTKPIRRKSQFILINIRDFLWMMLWIVVFENSLVCLVYLLVKRIKDKKTGIKITRKPKTKDRDINRFNSNDSGNLF